MEFLITFIVFSEEYQLKQCGRYQAFIYTALLCFMFKRKYPLLLPKWIHSCNLLCNIRHYIRSLKNIPFLGFEIASTQLEEAAIKSGVFLRELMTTLAKNFVKNVNIFCQTLIKLLLKIVQQHLFPYIIFYTGKCKHMTITKTLTM